MLLDKKIRILQCIRQGQIGGGESHLLSLVENMNRHLYEPVVLSFTDGPMITRLKKMNINTHIIHTEKPFDFRVWKKVEVLIKSEKIDLIHCHGTRAISNVYKAGKSLNIPVIYTVHGWSFHNDQHPLIKRIRIMGEKFLTSRSAINIAVSQSNMISGKQFLPNFNATVINNGIDLQKFNAQKKFKDIRAELKIKEDVLLLIFIARFTAHKQPLSLIQSFAEVIKKEPALQLLMVGEGDEKKEALATVNKQGLQHNIHFLPFRQDVPDLLAAADIFVLPSLWEGLPIGLLEAMSMGKCVIASNVDGTSEIVKHGKNGVLIETKNLVKNLTDAIFYVVANKQLRQQLADNAIKTVTENFNAATMTKKIETVYENILSNQTLSRAKLISNGI